MWSARRPQRYGEHQVDQRCSNEEKGEVTSAEVARLLDDQVDKGITDRDNAEHADCSSNFGNTLGVFDLAPLVDDASSLVLFDLLLWLLLSEHPNHGYTDRCEHG